MDRDDHVRSYPEVRAAGDFKIKGAACLTRRGSSSACDACIICLQPITERAVAVPCNHLAFDFVCLASWLQERTSCPLCNASVTAVQYDWRGPQDYKTYSIQTSATAKSTGQPSTHPRRRRIGGWNQDLESAVVASQDPALERRRSVYHEELYSLHVGANLNSEFAEFTFQTFAQSPEMQSRARTFLRRELLVFAFLDHNHVPRGGGRQYLVEYIVAVLKTRDPKGADGHAQELLVPFIGRSNAEHLLHELTAWLRSPYARLADWDEVVQYAQPHHYRKGPSDSLCQTQS